MNDSINERANEVAKNNAINQAELTSKLNVISARAEVLSMVVNILNAFLGVRQGTDRALTDDEIAAIQNAINQENAVTNQLYNQIEATLGLELPSISSETGAQENTFETQEPAEVHEDLEAVDSMPSGSEINSEAT